MSRAKGLKALRDAQLRTVVTQLTREELEIFLYRPDLHKQTTDPPGLAKAKERCQNPELVDGCPCSPWLTPINDDSIDAEIEGSGSAGFRRHRPANILSQLI